MISLHTIIEIARALPQLPRLAADFDVLEADQVQFDQRR